VHISVLLKPLASFHILHFVITTVTPVLLIASAARRDPSKRSQRVRRIRGGSQLALRPHDDSFEDLFLLASNSCVCACVCGFPLFSSDEECSSYSLHGRLAI
jgi:hypothetical protein